jgi:hypothetical protein
MIVLNIKEITYEVIYKGYVYRIHENSEGRIWMLRSKEDHNFRLSSLTHVWDGQRFSRASKARFGKLKSVDQARDIIEKDMA